MLPNYLVIYNPSRSLNSNKTVMFRFLHFMYSDFISEAATSMNDPSLSYQKPESSKTNLTPYRKINVKKTEFAEVPNCPIYNTLHRRNKCRKPLKERKQILLDNNLCYKCCESKTHVYKTVPRNNQQMHYGGTPRFVDGMST